MKRSMPPETSTADLVHELGLDKQVRLALVDADPEDRERLTQAVRRSDLFEYDVCGFSTLGEGLDAIATGRFDLALVEYDLGDATGVELIRRARARGIDVPIVIITGQVERRMDFEVLRDGGADLVSKEEISQPSVLERVVRHTLLRCRQAKELERRASYDDLTGLANRTFFRAVLERRLRTAAREHSEVSVVYLDLDGFKAVNDRFGHLTGDAVLRSVAARLQDAVDETDLVARLGGDEFAVVVQGGDERAKKIQRRIQHVLAADFDGGGRWLRVGASVGSASFPQDGTTADRLVDHADRMMYGAKQRAATERGAAGAHDRWWRRLHRLVEDFPKALDNDELHLVFQPQVDELGQRLRSVEALIRWDHPSLGRVSPADFIPAIERCGLSYELDTWVIRNALKIRRQWVQRGVLLPRVAVNVSAKTLLQPGLLKLVEEELRSNGQSADDLEIELTETAVLDAQAGPVMQALRSNGIALAIDDFGVGESSLASLAQTPASVLKLDRTLLVGAAFSERHQKILRWAIGLGRDLGMEIVAEGIEAQSQLDWLRKEAVDGYQGYLFSRPLADAELVEWFTQAAIPAAIGPRPGRDDRSRPPTLDRLATTSDGLSHLPC